VSAYAANVIAEKTEKRFVQYWSTWVTGWRDWLEPDAGACATDGGERVYDFGGGDARD
jgi:hypothetical protein